jgi:hypothetical protein
MVHRRIPSLPLDPRQPHTPNLSRSSKLSITLNLSLYLYQYGLLLLWRLGFCSV